MNHFNDSVSSIKCKNMSNGYVRNLYLVKFVMQPSRYRSVQTVLVQNTTKTSEELDYTLLIIKNKRFTQTIRKKPLIR